MLVLCNYFYRRLPTNRIIVSLDTKSLFEKDKEAIIEYNPNYKSLLRSNRCLNCSLLKSTLFKYLNKYPKLAYQLKVKFNLLDKSTETACTELSIVDAYFLELAYGRSSRLLLDDFSYSDFVFEMVCFVLDNNLAKQSSK